MQKKPKSKAGARVVNSLVTPVEAFLAMESAGGILLLLATIAAMVWANSPFWQSYEHFVEQHIAFSFGSFNISKTVHHWVNDGLMVIFFYVVGLEIKRELTVGELSTPRRAILPMVAALGGMIFPAIIYSAFNLGKIGESGWGIPMATDIAFAVGILTLMSRKVPFALKIFLLALAIVDDLGAVIVIAFFYTEQIATQALGFAALGMGIIYLLRASGVERSIVYFLLSIAVWFAVLKSGVHATVAGVVLGFLTPIGSRYKREELTQHMRGLADDIHHDIIHSEDLDKPSLSMNTSHKLHELSHYATRAQSPLERNIHLLHPWVTYVIMPIFALVNAGVHISGFDFTSFIHNDIALGVILGLLLGKPVGVLLMSWLAVKGNIASLPRGVTWTHIAAVGFLAGIGFTMALFVSNLALKVPELEMFSKLGILAGSLLSGILGSIMIMRLPDTEKSTQQ